jgi:hypothetical protein
MISEHHFTSIHGSDDDNDRDVIVMTSAGMVGLIDRMGMYKVILYRMIT